MSLVLAFALALGLVPVTAFAEESGILINATSFPDSAFRTYVATLDTSNDGKLSDSEISAVTSMNVDNLGIGSLEGIEYFTELETLSCSGNKLVGLDLSANTQLVNLTCTGNSRDVTLSKSEPEFEFGALGMDCSAVSGFSVGSQAVEYLHTIPTDTTEITYNCDVNCSGVSDPVAFKLNVNWVDAAVPAYTDIVLSRLSNTSLKAQLKINTSGKLYAAPTETALYEKILADDGVAFTAGYKTITLNDYSETDESFYFAVKDNNGVIYRTKCYSVYRYDANHVNLFDAMSGLSAETLPASFDYELGTEKKYSVLLYNFGMLYSQEFYARLVKLEVTSAAFYRLAFSGKTESIDTVIDIFKQENGGISHLHRQDSDDYNGDGERFEIQLSPGTYYIALYGYGGDSGKCQAEMAKTDRQPATDVSLLDALKDLSASATLSSSFAHDLGQDGKLYQYERDSYTYEFFARLVRLDLTAVATILTVKFGEETDSSIDTRIWLFRKNGDEIEYISQHDNDNYCGYGEQLHNVLSAGTYYLVLAGYDDSEFGVCNGSITAVAADNLIEGHLCFIGTDVPVPDEDALWSWNAETKTLTLKDGFSVFCDADHENHYSAICLPDNSTVAVEGTATVITAIGDGDTDDASDAIYCTGALTVQGKKGGSSRLIIDSASHSINLHRYSDESGISLTVKDIGLELISNRYGIYANDMDLMLENVKFAASSVDSNAAVIRAEDITVLDSSLELEGNNLGIRADGDISIKNSSLYLKTWNDGIRLHSDYTTLRAESSSIITLCRDESIDGADDCKIELIDCYTYLDSTYDEEGIYCLGENSSITISGGSFTSRAKEDALEAGSITLEDVVFELETVDEDYTLLDFNGNGGTGFSLPGVFRLYDFDGELLYEGEWTDDLIFGGDLVYDETPVFRAVSVHEHTPVTKNGKLVCSVCRAPLGDATEDGAPKTGDNANILLWTVLLLASLGAGAAIAVVVIKRKKAESK